MPFGEYKDFQDCVNHNKDKGNPQAYCATVHKKITGQWPSEAGADENKCVELEKALVLYELEKKIPSGEMAKPGGDTLYPDSTLRGYAESSKTGLLRGPNSKAAKPGGETGWKQGTDMKDYASTFDKKKFPRMAKPGGGGLKKAEDPEEVHAKGDVKPPDVCSCQDSAALEGTDPIGSDKAKQIKK